MTSIVVDDVQAQEGEYPGISARAVEVWTATEENHYTKVATLEVPRGQRCEFALPADTQARWLKIVQTSNWGNPHYTEMMELEAYGTPVGAAQRSPIRGVYETKR